MQKTTECILVVEDEPILRVFIADQLRDQGYVVVEVETGEKAIALLSEAARAPIRAVFTDIELPGRLSGWDVADAFRQRVPKYRSFTPPGMLRVSKDEFHEARFCPNRIDLVISSTP